MRAIEADALRIRTPEGVVFSLPLAGPVRRCIAMLLDMFCISVIMITIGYLVRALSLLGDDLAGALYYLFFFVISTGYGTALEWRWRGQTVGKRVMRLRVMDAEGLRLRPAQIVLRNLLRPVDSLPVLYLLGGAVTFFNQRRQRLGDLAAGTVVIAEAAIEEPDFARIASTKFNSLAAYPHLAARLRMRVPAAVVAVTFEALLRRDQFEPGPRLELYRTLADHFRSEADFPAAATEDLSDEQYLRNVLEVIAHQRKR
jgi:uncharacterized RDD family membrane protein YckC